MLAVAHAVGGSDEFGHPWVNRGELSPDHFLEGLG